MNPEVEQTIRIGVRSVDRLLDMDFTPLSGPGIHPHVARAIKAEAASYARKARFHLEVEVPSVDVGRSAEVEVAVRTHFLEELAELNEELKSIAHKGRWTFALAVCAVGILIWLSELVLLIGEGRFVAVLSESLIIMAWVSLWGPAETLLFARFPIIRQRRLVRSLADTRVSLVAAH